MATFLHKSIASAVIKRQGFSLLVWGSPYTAARQYVPLAELAGRFALYSCCLADLLGTYRDGDREDVAGMRQLLRRLNTLRARLDDPREVAMMVDSKAVVYAWLARQHMADLLACDPQQ